MLLAQVVPVLDDKVDACGVSGKQSWLCSTVYDITESERAADIADSLHKPLAVLVILIGALVVTRLLRLLIKRMVQRLDNEGTRNKLSTLRRRTGLSLLDTSPTPSLRRLQRAQTISTVLRSVTSIVVWSIALFWILQVIGINAAPLLAGSAVVGVALGFGAQSLVRDFLSGIFMLIEDQYGVGDVIDVGSASGTVEAVSLRVTRLRDVEGVVWHIPNGEIRRVGNKSQQWSRALLDVAVDYRTDVQQATDVIKRVADEMWHDPSWEPLILGEPEVWGVEELGIDRVLIRLVVKTRPLEQWKIARELRARLKAAFDESGIKSPAAQPVVTFSVAQSGAEPTMSVEGGDDASGR